MISEVYEYCKNRFEGENFDEKWEEYQKLPPFKISQNVNDVGGISEEAHFIMRTAAKYYMEKVFEAMKIDLTDPNVSGEKGTPYRIIKMWTGAHLEDDSELMSGRWMNEPRMAYFPDDSSESGRPVFVKTDLNAVCSHHVIRFGEDYYDEDSFVVIGYIPEGYIGGISKINRLVNFCARRGWLQEDLTKYIGEKIKEKFKTTSVYVALFNMKHGCASYRGACDTRAATTTIFKSGKFKDDPSLIPSKYQ